MTPADPWIPLRQHTMARIALGRSGASLPTAECLRFAQAHALARDAVHEALDVPTLAAELRADGFAAVHSVRSAAPDRATFLRRPDLGRRLQADDAAALRATAGPAAAGLVVVVADGLAARAAQQHARPLLRALRSALEAQIFGPAPPLHAVVLATQGRVALGDGIADALNARAVLVLLGERPGLSSPDSLGGYLSWRGDPGFAGLRDAERNCVSNIRSQGQAPELAAWRIAWLLAAAARLGATGVVLKDGSEAAIATLAAPQAAPPALAGQSAPCSGNTP
jgi:ethanolamine ammonia-lyase small subunit